MNGILTDLRYALRLFRRDSAFFWLVVAILALGIASSVSVFSLVDGILLRPLPYRDPQRLVTLTSYSTKPPFDSNGSVSYHDYLQFKSKARSFSDIAVTFRTGWSRVTLNGPTEPTPVQGAFVSPDLFSLFGRQPLIGRTFTPEENAHAERVVVVSQGLWSEWFGSSPQAIGQELRIGKTAWRIIGVMPADFRVPFLGTQLWAPVLSHPDWNEKNDEVGPLDSARWDLMARLKPGVSLRTAQGEVNAIEKGLQISLPEFHADSVRVAPLREHFTGQVWRQLLVLLGAVGFLLFIACANVANLLLARASRREREMATRSALGASRTRILRQLVMESLALSCASAVLAIGLAFTLVPVLKSFAPASTPLLDSVTLNERGLIFDLLLSLAVGALLGVAPLWQLSRTETNDFLRSAGRNATDRRGSTRFKSLLVAAEFAVAMVLLTGAGLLIRSFAAVLSVDPGFQTGKVLSVEIGLPADTRQPQLQQFYRDALTQIGTLPGVQAAGGISHLFFLNEGRTHALRIVEGRPPEPMSAWTPLVWAQVTGDYFRGLGVPLLRGRFFDDRDGPDAPPVAIINETLARRYWPNEDAVGKRLKGFDPRGKHDDWLTVVGVVADTRSGGLERAPFSQIYEVQAQRGDQIGTFVVRASDPTRIAASIRPMLHRLNPTVIVQSIATVQQLVDAQETQRRFETWLIGVFSSIALALATFGVFAIMHYWVAAKRSEIGVRIALGARGRDVIRLVLGNGGRLAIYGVLVGTLVAMWLTELISGMLYNVKPGDPLTFIGAAVSLFAVALAGCYFPARAASRVDPISALRAE